MKVGSLVFATDQGLGILAKSFFDAGVVTDVLVIRHGRRLEHDEWYLNSRRIGSLKDPEQIDAIENFCLSMDVMFFFETPFLWTLIGRLKDSKTKTVLMPMYECSPKELANGSWDQPDLYICPSLLDLQCFPRSPMGPNGMSVFIPVPVETPWKLRKTATTFVHNAGHGGLNGRNGTKELIQALPLVKSPATFVIRAQPDRDAQSLVDECAAISFKVDVHCSVGNFEYSKLYDDGDVFVFPEKFNGLSLPLQEARAAGMLVMATDRFPMNTWLPVDCWTLGEQKYPVSSPLIPTSGSRKSSVAGRCLEFDEAIVDPKDIAAKIDEWYGRDITDYSLSGKRWSEENSWEALKPRYVEALKELCRS